MINLLFTAPIKKETFEKISPEISKLGYSADFLNERKIEGKINADKYDVLLCYDPFDKLEFSDDSSLKAIITSSTGINQVPDFLIAKENMQVANNRGGYSIPIAEWIVMSFLLGIKNYPAIEHKKREKIWEIEKDTQEAENKKVLFLGAGTIATEAAKRLRNFNVELLAYRRSGRDNPNFDRIVKHEELDKELSAADAVVICLPDTKETQKFVDAKKLSLMKDDSIFINIARGSIVDQDVLLKCIDEGKFRFLALDVFENEPLEKESPFWNIDRVFLSTHTSWYSQNRERRVYEHFMRNLESFAKSGKLYNQVNKGLKY